MESSNGLGNAKTEEIVQTTSSILHIISEENEDDKKSTNPMKEKKMIQNMEINRPRTRSQSRKLKSGNTNQLGTKGFA